MFPYVRTDLKAAFLIRRLLYSVLPPSVAQELRHRRPVPAKKHEKVTIMFSGIAGFADFCHRKSGDAMKIVNLLNMVYTKYDTLTDKNPNVYKVKHYYWSLFKINTFLLGQFAKASGWMSANNWMRLAHDVITCSSIAYP